MKMMAIGMSKEFGTSTLAGSESEHARIPMVLPNDREAVDAAIATIGPERKLVQGAGWRR